MTMLKWTQLAVLSVFTCQIGASAVLLDITSALTNTDPTQLGRLSRNGIAQDWTGAESFPGVINPGVSYAYHTYAVNVGLANFVQITIDDVAGNALTFASAYDTAYLPGSLSTNWLGDAGASGNFFGVDPRFFQVIEPVNGTLQVVINDTSATGAGIGQTYRLTVEGFIDTDFDDPPAVPEPATVLYFAPALAALLFCFRRQNSTTSA